MERQIWAFDKFWIIWSSCLDRPRTINEIQDFWGYDGNALYQKGLNKSIWKEMLEKGFIESKGKVKVRGVSGDLIYGKTEWIFDFLDEHAKKSRVSFENDLPFHILSCIKNKKKLLYYIDTNREVFFMLQRLKILFGDKQNLKNNYELCITAPLITIFNYFIIVTLKKKLKVDLDSILLLSQSLIFSPYFGTNFFSYYKSVIKDLSTKEMPLDLFDEAKVFKLWKDYSKEIMKEMSV